MIYDYIVNIAIYKWKYQEIFHRQTDLTNRDEIHIIVKLITYRGVAQLVARLVRVQEAVGSTPATPTKKEVSLNCETSFFRISIEPTASWL